MKMAGLMCPLFRVLLLVSAPKESLLFKFIIKYSTCIRKRGIKGEEEEEGRERRRGGREEGKRGRRGGGEEGKGEGEKRRGRGGGGGEGGGEENITNFSYTIRLQNFQPFSIKSSCIKDIRHLRREEREERRKGREREGRDEVQYTPPWFNWDLRV